MTIRLHVAQVSLSSTMTIIALVAWAVNRVVRVPSLCPLGAAGLVGRPPPRHQPLRLTVAAEGYARFPEDHEEVRDGQGPSVRGLVTRRESLRRGSLTIAGVRLNTRARTAAQCPTRHQRPAASVQTWGVSRVDRCACL